jgi:hypothetical protein
VLAPRDIDEYLLPTERRVIRVRQHFALMLKDVLVTALFLLLMWWHSVTCRRVCWWTTSPFICRWSR